VLAVGDLHLENFGTWRLADGRHGWGVNDADEAAELPYTNDLVRLVASIELSRERLGLELRAPAVAELVLGGYADALAGGGAPVVVEECAPALAGAIRDAIETEYDFWEELLEESRAEPGEPPRGETARALELARSCMPAGVTEVRAAARAAGAGSLGRVRVTVIALRDGEYVAREAKRLAPPAAAWATGADRWPDDLPARLTAAARRLPDPALRYVDRFVVRRLAPHSHKATLRKRMPAGEIEALLAAMGRETANVHLGSPGADAVAADLARRPDGWLHRAARAMARDTAADFREWTG
jgi:hypothetical protein